MSEVGHIVVIGGGVAGCAVAYSLSAAGAAGHHRRARGRWNAGLGLVSRRDQSAARDS